MVAPHLNQTAFNRLHDPGEGLAQQGVHLLRPHAHFHPRERFRRGCAERRLFAGAGGSLPGPAVFQ